MKLRRFLLLLVAPLLLLHAQDAALVLRTSVTYRTQRNTLPLTDAQKQQADALMREAERANAAGQYGEAMRAMLHGMAAMHGTEWTSAAEFAAALRTRLDHEMLEPGQHATLTLTQLFPVQLPVEMRKMSASVMLGDANSGHAAVDAAALPQMVDIAVADLPAGNYNVEVRLAAGDMTVATARVPVHVERLSAAAGKLRARVAKAHADGRTLATAAYALTLYERADAGDVNFAHIDFDGEFAAANALLDAVDAGRDPFAGRRGDLHLAYRSAVDRTLQPYRLFIPDAYDPAKTWPLVVALHGMGGDENTMFDAYAGAVKRAAERLGLLVVCPKGRDTASMYRGAAEQDVMDVLAEVRRDYKIDPGRIYLMGHSMGGYGTWSTAMDHPDVFAALGPISGGGDPAGMVKIKDIPEYVVHGDADPTVPVENSRAMVAAGKKAGARIEYVEIHGGNHTSVAAPQIAPMFEFFVKQRKQ